MVGKVTGPPAGRAVGGVVGDQVLPHSVPMAAMTSACQARTSASDALRVALFVPAWSGGISGAPRWMLMGCPEAPRPVPSELPRKRMPTGRIGAPVSSDRRAAPQRPRSNRRGSRLMVPSGNRASESPARSRARACSRAGVSSRNKGLSRFMTRGRASLRVTVMAPVRA
jgi:hypothetical protein